MTTKQPEKAPPDNDAISQAPTKFVYGNLTESQQWTVLEECASRLRHALGDNHVTEDDIFGELETKLRDAGLKSGPDKRQRLSLLRELWKAGYLRLIPRLDEKLQRELKESFQLRDVVVVMGADPSRFSQAAAELFIKQVRDIGKIKKAKGRPLNVGIVSGRTTGDVIRAACEFDWRQVFGFNANDLPQVRVFALNVCLTGPKDMHGNATVLVHKFADKINDECAYAQGVRIETQALAYGLSAPLLVERSELARIDASPQTFELLCATQPGRVLHRLKELFGDTDGPGRVEYSKLARENCLPDDPDHIAEFATDLDIVLTGVGEPAPKTPLSRGTSIFYNIALQVQIPMERLVKQYDIVGDLAFTAIDRDGSSVPLKMLGAASTSGGPDAGSDKEYVFYCAVDLPTFERMASDPSKAVVLVARHSSDGQGKGPAIAASVKGRPHRYASHLVVDRQTASNLPTADNAR